MPQLLYALLILASFIPAAFSQDVVQPREYRAVWLTTLQGLDWPRTKARDAASTELQKAELCDLLDKLQAAGMNTVLFQTRIRGTAAYPSDIEPWDAAFSGQAARSPGYDPLLFAIEETHRRGMELHAWVVAYPLGKIPGEKALGKRALSVRRPELCVKAGEQWMMNPGVPETADYIADVCREIVSRYDVDGIHLDYIRYPEKEIPFNDERTYKRFGAGENKRQWRKDNVTRTVRKVHDAVKALKPWVKLSCSPVGKYADLPRQSSRGWNARDAVSQDASAWLNDGLMDVLFPMLYFDGNNFYPFALDWKERRTRGNVAPGLAVYMLSPNERNWPLIALQRQMNFTENLGLDGFALFRARFLTDDTKGIYGWVRDVRCRRPAQTPPCPTDAPLFQSPEATVERTGGTLRFAWQPQKDAIYHIVYRLNPDGSIVRLARIKDGRSFTYTPALPRLLKADYAITAEDIYGRECEPSLLSATTAAEVSTTTSDVFPITSDVLSTTSDVLSTTSDGFKPAYYDLYGRRIPDITVFNSPFYFLHYENAHGTSVPVAVRRYPTDKFNLSPTIQTQP